MIDRPNASNEEQVPPKKQTEPRRSSGGDSSGVPPHFKVATDLEDWEQPYSALEDRPLKPPPMFAVFGIDFGDETTRIAGVLPGSLALIGPKIVPTGAVADQSQGWESHWRHRIAIGSLRSRLRTGTPAILDGQTYAADVLAIRFFAGIRESLLHYTSGKNPRVILNVPSFYTNSEKANLCSVVQAASFEVLGTINDYASPVMSFSRRGFTRFGKILSVSIGSNSLSVAVLDNREGIVRTMAAAADASFGGARLMREVASFWRSESSSADEPTASMDEEFVAHAQEQDIAIESLSALAANRTGTSSESERNEVKELLRDRLTRVRDLADLSCKSCETSLESIDFVLMNGRIINNKLIRLVLASFFPGRKIVALNADKASCFGAALHASVLAGMSALPVLVDLESQ